MRGGLRLAILDYGTEMLYNAAFFSFKSMESGPLLTNDKMIRTALRADLERKIAEEYRGRTDVRIVEELGVAHGAARMDLALINGVLHGYELKSDQDTLDRLPEQMRFYNAVFDHVTLVVGKTHLHAAIQIIPDWWGIMVAKSEINDKRVSFFNIRPERDNPKQDYKSIAALLWRDEALGLLEEIGQTEGVRSKNRQAIYDRLAATFDKEKLKARVRESLCSRPYWRTVLQCTPSGG